MQLKTNCYLSSVLDQKVGLNRNSLLEWMKVNTYTHTHTRVCVCVCVCVCIFIIAIVAIVKNSVSNQINDFFLIKYSVLLKTQKYILKFWLRECCLSNLSSFN